MNLDTCQNLYLTEFSHRTVLWENPGEDKFGPFLWVFPWCVRGQPLLLNLQPSGEDPTHGWGTKPFFQPREEAVFDSVCIDEKYKGTWEALLRVSSLPLLSREGFEYIWEVHEDERGGGRRGQGQFLSMDYPEEEMTWKDENIALHSASHNCLSADDLWIKESRFEVHGSCTWKGLRFHVMNPCASLLFNLQKSGCPFSLQL